MIKADYHTHTNFSTDGQATMDAMIEQAIKLGLKEYAITDHMDFTYPDRRILGNFEASDMVNAMQAAKTKYEGRIKVLVGMEISLRPDVADIARQMVSEHEFDFIIGSPHDVKGIDVGWTQFHHGRTKHEAHAAYFEHMLDVVHTCDSYDVLGHFDYVERYGPYTDKSLRYDDHREIIDEILKIVISKGKGIEINTAGYFYGLGHAHPQMDILQRYMQLGGEIITIGSDAHRPENIAQYFDDAYKMLQQVGVKYIALFDKRKPRFISI